MNNNLYYITTEGLYVIGGGNPILVGEKSPQMPYGQVCAMVTYGDYIIIGTYLNGLFLFNGRNFTPLETKCDTKLKQDQLFSLAIEGDKLACGTIIGGVSIVNLKSGEYERFDISSGLGNNTLLSMMFDQDNNLWCGLDNGIDMIKLNSRLRHLKTNKEYRFSGYCALVDGEYIYIGTNQGLLRIKNNPKNDDTESEQVIIENSKGQVWNLQKIDDKIFCSHNRGLFTIENRATKPYLKSVYNKDGVWDLTNVEKDKYIIGTYGGIELIDFSQGNTPQTTKIEGYNGSVRSPIFDYKSRSLFFVTGDGLERIRFDSNFKISSSKILIPSTLYDTKTLRIDDDIIIYTPSNIYVIDDQGTLLPTNKYNALFSDNKSYSMIELDKDQNLWTVDNDRLMYRKYNKARKSYESSAQMIYNSKHFFILGFTKVEKLSDRHYIVNNISGFSIVDVSVRDNRQAKVINPVLIGIYDTSRRDSLLLSCAYGVEPKEVRLPHSQNSLRFTFSSDNIESSGVEFSYRLKGDDDNWSDWEQISMNGIAGAINQKEYTNLFEGEYSFDLRLRDGDMNVRESNIKVKVLPPWQRSIWMKIIYAIIFCILVLLFRHRVNRYYSYRRRLVELKKEREIINQQRLFQSKSIEQENSIMRLKNEKLESDIIAKSNELSNLMLNRLEKNDIITSVKSDLDKIRIETLNERYDNVVRRIKTLEKRLDDRLIDNIDWSTFEDNFNLINNNFAQKITEQFSWMNTNERKLCVYIKMGLQNKEIAPLLNLSVRGVEMLRYRIRKKMELERSDNLYEFFQRL